ncbi:MAG: S46 family peptidase [Rhodothermaceae bacterium]|nr:S46 family peptidase [Rhodothermaceae bacterium]MXX59247.1 S46 family peptidase [Rhodothermaceae bacterium]MYD19303.1 S46 family peptidase [Rhodothermaceae bacterium]MYD55662.1 S46 family peptidase [Rhodothermaceae bacterium]MYI44712.1 S46 family peptidase [Rhodothermaceae bacterium]
MRYCSIPCRVVGALLFGSVAANAFAQVGQQSVPLSADDNAEVEHVWRFAQETESRSSLPRAVDANWIENARLGTLKLSGCAAALVSADGLAVTSATCLRSLENWIRPDDSVFVAGTLLEERKLPGLTARQLVEIREFARIEEASEDLETGFEAELIAADDSSTFWEYVWRTYGDVRLVVIPPADVTDFGNEEGVYPRYAIDFALFRVYDGQALPLETESYFAWNDRSPYVRERLFATAFDANTPFTVITLSDTFSYNGTISPPHTTLYGMLDQYYSHGATGAWELTEDWLSGIKENDLATALNFSVVGECAQTGAGLINVDMEILGIAFDNANTEEGTRCVVMSTSGILALLRTVLKAQGVADELAEQALP